MKKKIISILKTIYDPEININIVDLGLIYNINYNKKDKEINILMTFTSPTCPLIDDIFLNIKKKIKKKIKKIKKININITFNPPWNKKMISDEAKLELGIF
ncbi:MAG: metal-sulfur cluster assembly factor [Candidatus Shikimatogenerans bostrichidophilus]|nr:MAG: metal-sulfur cluster assembly factor [Candidatus Shikimatogenerans bostrichidophilus]